jgi:hypothetical protein
LRPQKILNFEEGTNFIIVASFRPGLRLYLLFGIKILYNFRNEFINNTYNKKKIIIIFERGGGAYPYYINTWYPGTGTGTWFSYLVPGY